MEDEAADIELLEQHLNKTNHISQRMTAILSKFDTRLVKLEKSILPLHKSTQTLTRLADNIESTLQSIEKVASSQENAASEEALILRGPQPGQLSTYTDALDRLNVNFAFAADRMPKDAARLVETAAKKLTQLYTKLVAEGSSGSTSASPDLTPPPFPPSLMNTLTPVVASLRALPLPATHPSHPAAPGILTTLKEAQKGYADMRGQWARKCLETQSRRVLVRVETMDGVDGGREFGRFVESILNHAEAEHALLVSLAPMPSANQTTYDDLIQPMIVIFQSTLNSFSALIKRSLTTYTFLALSAYSSLSALQSWWDDAMGKRAGRRDNELKEGLHSLRGVCLRSFPEFLADIKLMGMRPPEGQFLGTGVSDLTVNTIKYLKQIPDVETAVITSLVTLGDGNWKMGEGVGKGGKVGGPTDGNERVLLEHYIYDVIVTHINTLNTLSKAGRRPQMGSIYLLNNVSHVRNQLIDSPDSTIDTFLSKPTQDILNSNFRTARAAYFDSNFSPLIQALADEKERSGGLVGGGKSAIIKEKWSRFFDALDEVTERHRVARVLADDPEGRSTLQDEVVRLVIPALLRFTQKNKEKEFSKHPEKYIKASPEEVEQQIRNFFR
ncbi:Cullin repeat-like-containing domain protein [Gautieria morchelliformis]|nr:Cullin repeat-like-containing domain protein [Gautieria morchelliformis]